ncbi:hypothetical protein HHK36_012509 [Tetracentron sinense]|uniref:J domain-containing protein n=1 Tax=Tetracentron sinense TaxID=13715 RepID=A0A835DI65_TETSI|nr:hypothetical protein HHK36_012509 [Tetracentron sinense]
MMDCNKEEAIRAMRIAEKKMQYKDFVGARKIVLKAQQLCPELENISQMLTVCDVHCSAEHKTFGSEMDWYGILQIEQTEDEASIKKQYRNLAFLLHPDKNKSFGAEAAFKLIAEAKRILSDPEKRSLHDIKRRVSLRTVAPNLNSYVRKQSGVQNSFVDIATPQTMGLNPLQQQQQTQQGFSNIQQTFWTICPFCGIRYQYYRDNVNRALHCQSCMKPFIAYDSYAQGVPPEDNWSQPAIPQQKEVPNQGADKVGPQNAFGIVPFSMGVQGRFGCETTASEPFPKTGRTSEVCRGSKTKGKEDGNVDMEVGKKERGRKAGMPEESEPLGDTSRKRRRSSVLESSCSCDTEDDDLTEEDSGLTDGLNLGFMWGHCPRRSARQKLHVSYSENLNDDDDFVIPPKSLKGSGSPSATEQSKEASLNGKASETDKPAGFAAIVEEDKEEVKQKASTPLEESLLNRNDKAEECKANGNESAAMDVNERSEVNEESDSRLNPNGTPNREYCEYPDPDFSDFDKERGEECFAVNQIWAVYDIADGMPRLYVRIRKVFSPGFKLRIIWLDPDPDDQEEIDWVSENWPVGCGKFKNGKSESIIDRFMFSHMVYWERGSSRDSYKIYPRKGEIWALFKNWDIKWRPDPDNHRQYEFEFVEVLSDYGQGAGINVTYLGKVKGFVSLFSRTIKKGVVSFQISTSELFRFSHKIPSFRMTGKERENVLEGSFELDPASLPANLEEFSHPGDVLVHTGSMDTNVNGSCPKLSADKVNHMSESKKPNMPKKIIDLDVENSVERRNSKSGNQSPKNLNRAHKMPGQANASQCAAKGETSKHLYGIEDTSHGEKIQAEGSAFTCQADEMEKHIDADQNGPNNVTKDPSFPPASSAEEIPEAEFYDFDGEKSQEKFEPGQTWALYCDLDGMPKYYARIKKIESSPDLKLHVSWLEGCSLAKDMIQLLDKDMPLCCGTFKRIKGKSAVFYGTTAFSHQLRAEPTGKNRYDIYPRKGEVWALYKNWNSEWKRLDLNKNCEYDIVEVLEDNDWGTKLSVLVPVDGFKLVFRAKRKGRSAIIKIPRTELVRFSHQTPAFQLTQERDGSLRGCWELDPASLPISFSRSN